jgi:hypothetical protein
VRSFRAKSARGGRLLGRAVPVDPEMTVMVMPEPDGRERVEEI